jgi:hypothetical protein
MKKEPKLWHIPLGMVLALVAIGLIMCGCKSVEYVTVPEVHEVHHHHTDSVIQRDSVVKESLTTVMQLDSAAMAKYGIQLKSAERAWLVKTAELQRQIERLEAMSLSKDSVHDSIPVPYPVVKEVPAELSWWQRLRIILGNFVILAVIAIAGYWVWRLWRVYKFF